MCKFTREHDSFVAICSWTWSWFCRVWCTIIQGLGSRSLSRLSCQYWIRTKGKERWRTHNSHDTHEGFDTCSASRIKGTYLQDKYVKCLLEINADAFPELARMIKSGHTTDLSMGCSVKYSTCSICNHKAASVNLYCGHIKHHKGSIYNGLPVFEDNHDIEFIELSIVSKAADSTAKVLEVLARKKGLDLQQVLQKAAADPMYADSLINNSDDSIERVVIKAIKRANQIRGTK